MHQIDNGVIISFLKAILRKCRVSAENPLGLAGAAAKKLTNRLRLLLGKVPVVADSVHVLSGYHACMAPFNFATCKILQQA